jgi:Cu-Zn family superoxide dismutase
VWLFAAVLAGCGSAGSGRPTAVADVQGLGDHEVTGKVEFTPLADGRVRVSVVVEGLTPGPHGIHIHEFGDCSDPKGELAGDHFNPDMVAHAGPEAPKHHAGDLGNITADGDGRGNMTLETHGLALERGPSGALGRAVIVHAQADDLMSQPSGKSGPRIACGVIRAVSGATEPVLPAKS